MRMKTKKAMTRKRELVCSEVVVVIVIAAIVAVVVVVVVGDTEDMRDGVA